MTAEPALDLVIHGPGFNGNDDTQVAEAARLCGTPAANAKIESRHARLPGVPAPTAQLRDSLAAYCNTQAIDFAFVPSAKRLTDIRLVAMDMDSTLITIECIDEIADMQGIKPQVAAITASAMRGEIDFPESLRRRVGLLKGLSENALQRVYDERLKLSPGAEAMLAKFKAQGTQTLLVSGGFTFFTERLKRRLGLDHTLSNTLEIVDGKLTGKVVGDIVDATAKAAKLSAIRDSLKLTKDQVLGLGDGANDLLMLAEAGVSIAYHAKPVVREKATYSFNHAGLDGVLALFP